MLVNKGQDSLRSSTSSTIVAGRRCSTRSNDELALSQWHSDAALPSVMPVTSSHSEHAGLECSIVMYPIFTTVTRNLEAGDDIQGCAMVGEAKRSDVALVIGSGKHS